MMLYQCPKCRHLYRDEQDRDDFICPHDYTPLEKLTTWEATRIQDPPMFTIQDTVAKGS